MYSTDAINVSTDENGNFLFANDNMQKGPVINQPVHQTPEFIKGLGKGKREFTDAKNNVQKEFEEGNSEPRKPVI